MANLTNLTNRRLQPLPRTIDMLRGPAAPPTDFANSARANATTAGIAAPFAAGGGPQQVSGAVYPGSVAALPQSPPPMTGAVYPGPVTPPVIPPPGAPTNMPRFLPEDRRRYLDSPTVNPALQIPPNQPIPTPTPVQPPQGLYGNLMRQLQPRLQNVMPPPIQPRPIRLR